jgi:Mor family transcriptional regulator
MSKYKKIKQIVDEYNGLNACSLAIRFDFTIDKVKKIYKTNAEKQIEIPSLNQDLKIVEDQCGMSVVNALLDSYPGQDFYVPIIGKKLMIEKAVKTFFNGNNHIQLAATYDISLQKVYKILKKL